MLFNGGLYELGLNQFESNILFLSLVVLFLVDLIRYRRKQRIDVFLEGQNVWFRWLVHRPVLSRFCIWRLRTIL